MCFFLVKRLPRETGGVYYHNMYNSWKILHAVQHCRYKVWLLVKEFSFTEQDLELNEGLLKLPVKKITVNDKIAAAAWCYLQMQSGIKIDKVKLKPATIFNKEPESVFIKPERYIKQAQQLFSALKDLIERDKAPAFYRNNHCRECQFKHSCYKLLQERDCISLLGGMSANVLAKYHKKGITTVTQLSHTFSLRKRIARRAGSFLYELKALAIREQKTYVVRQPEISHSDVSIYIDFEGLPDNSLEYLLGIVIKEKDKPNQVFSFWAGNEVEAKANFILLIETLVKYDDAPIYHYGSYERTALKKFAKKFSAALNKEIPAIERRLVNILSFLRTHVYPPTYRNGLKEVAGFLGFTWTESEADGLLSIEWRTNWLETKKDLWKEKLIQYNIEDCLALIKIHEWLERLAENSETQSNVQEVSKLNRYSPYKLQRNEYNEDFDYINKAAYFDYQRTKIYWRNNQKKKTTKKGTAHKGKGKPVWKPSRIHETIILPALERCPHCNCDKLYIRTKQAYYIQTDLKFTSMGIKQWNIRYQSGGGKCSNCRKKYNDNILRRIQVGDNLMAWAVNLYVNYHISFALISNLLHQQFCIWTNPTYFNDRVYEWWDRFKPDVDYCWKIILNSPVMHIDETTVKLCTGPDKAYVWVFATTNTVYYHLTLNREAGFLHEWLKDYKGVIVTDFYPAYDALPMKRQKCLVHLIRDLNDDLIKNPFDDEYKTIVNAFGDLLKNVVATIDQFGLKRRHLQKHIRDTERFCVRHFEIEYKSELANKYVKRLKRHWDSIWMFLYHDAVPWNNNNAEVAIKAFAQHRRGVNGQFNTTGLKPYLSMLTISQTCRYREISFLHYLIGKVGIWQNIDNDLLPGILPFKQARLFMHNLKLPSIKALKEWEDCGNRPGFIPDNPAYFYREDGWRSWGDWIGIKFCH